MGLRLDRQHPSMHLFRRKARSPSPTPSIEVPRLCLPRQKATTEAPSDDDDMPAATSTLKSSSAMTARLKVPSVGRVRSSSFDSSSMMGEKASTLQLPPMSSQRSKSLDASYGAGSTSEETASDHDSTASLRIPVMARYYRRRSTDIPRLCIHCVHIESLSSQEPSPASSDGEFLFSCGDSTASGELSSSFDSLDEEDEIDHDSDRSPLQSCGSSDGADGTENGTGLTTLAVPLVKLRSSSFDSSCMVDSPVLAAVEQERRGSLDMLHVPQHGRSSSVDVNLPTCTSNRYRAMTFIPKRVKKAISKSTQDSSNLLHPSHAEYGYQKRELRSSVDWTEAAVNGDHMWTDTSASGDFCYVGEGSCSRTGQRKKCAACKILIHTGCLAELELIKVFKCKSTFREAGPRNYRENTSMRHHWVHRRRQEGKCKQCCKSFQQRFTFQSKEIIAISCSWCKVAYHNKVSCFMMQQIEETCSLGVHAGIIIPPSWIIKLPRKGSFKSSLRKKKRSTVKKRKSTDHKPFIIKPIPSPHMKPLLVFINPKSGGNQGAKLLHKFQWLLNPRQVFDLSQGGPVMALELFKKVPNLRILACGGDGTAGWILSTIDALGITPTPPMAVLPLGTGNDLARTLNWGGGYTDEPISKILCSVEEGPVVELDRWSMKCEPNPQTEQDGAEQEAGEKKLPLEIMNNYFSLGADANVTLEFHESREANPEKFNSRFKNKMFYAGAGGKDLLKRSWKNLADHIKIECDGKDLTTKIKELKVHCLVFLNIPRYAAGTQPWGTPNVNNTIFDPQKHDDGLLEVIGFTMTALATLQVGGHGLRLAQCQTVRLTTTKTIPMQVDGEPCKLAPSVVSISLRNRANVIKKPKHRGSVAIGIDSTTVSQEVDIRLISMTDYEALHYDKEKLKEASKPLNVHVETGMELEQVRHYINRLKVAGSEETQKPPAGLIQNLSTNWCFVDSTTAERFFRIDRAQENIHYVTDITSEDLYILDTDLKASFLQNGCDQDPHPHPTPETSHSTPQLSTPSAVIIQECDDPQMVRVPYNMPMTPPRSPGMTTPPPNGQQVNEHHPPLEPAISSEANTPHCVLSTTQPCRVDSETEMPHCILSTTQPYCVDSEAETPHCILSTSCVELSPVIFIEDAKEKSVYLNEKLMDASAEGNLPLVKELHAKGANLMAVDGNGMTALHHAAKLGSLDVVEYLIKNAPRELLDMIDREHGETALLKAACSQRRQICGVLVKAGASASKTDHKGNTPGQQALNAKDNELATYLKSMEKFQQVIAQDKETAV